MSLEATEKEAAAHAVAPRVALADIEAAIAAKYFMTGEDLNGIVEAKRGYDFANPPATLKCLTICLLVMNNGFTVIGKSAPASPENFNAELGRKFAYGDAVRQLWPLMGFALRDRLARGEN